jgi:hypothetical protein
MQVHFADHSTRHISGIADDTLVLIRDSHVLTYFAVLDTGRSQNTPIILGRPFLRTAKASIYAVTNNVCFDIGGKIEEFSFKTHKPIKALCKWRSKQNQQATSALGIPRSVWSEDENHGRI